MAAIKSDYILSSDEIKNNIRVFAGPGAGKTHFLVENIKNIITTNQKITSSKNRKVLCITYTNAAVDEIRRRLDRFSDTADICTIHGFIIDNIIKPFQDKLRETMKLDFAIEVEKKGIISSQIEGLGILHGVDKEKIYTFIKEKCHEDQTISYSKKIMSEVEVDCKAYISSLRQNKQLIKRFKSSAQIKENHIVVIKEFVWSKVKKLTHDEILYFGYRILEENPLAVYYLRVKYPYIFVDEFQDTNPLQTLLIKLLCEKSSRCCVVGDLAQSIYGFNGAYPDDFVNFKINDNDLDFAIKDNRRSSANIVNFCNFIRKQDRKVVQKNINDKIENTCIHILLGESQNVKTAISNVLLNGGVVLTRSWAAAFKYIEGIDPEQAQCLSNIYWSYSESPIRIRDEIVEFNNVIWVRAFKFIMQLWNGYNNGDLAEVISAFKLYGNIRCEVITPRLLSLLNTFFEKIFNNYGAHTVCEIIQKFNDKLNEEEYKLLKKLLDSENFKILIFDDQDKERLIKAVNKLKWETAYKLFNEVFTENSKYMTVHQAKGLEWETVLVAVMPGKNDSINITEMYASPQIIGSETSNEFVRIYYVACSRAIKNLYLHIPKGCSQPDIEKAIFSFEKETGRAINIEFIS